jgi:hypothetical protein
MFFELKRALAAEAIFNHKKSGAEGQKKKNIRFDGTTEVVPFPEPACLILGLSFRRKNSQNIPQSLPDFT